MRVSDDTEARIVRCASPEVVSSCVEVPSSVAEVPSSVVKMVSRVGETVGRPKNGNVMCERCICVVASMVVRERADICIRLSLKGKYGSIIEENQQMPVFADSGSSYGKTCHCVQSYGFYCIFYHFL